MIRDAEVRRLARVAGVEPRVVEADYVLGWALRAIAHSPHLGERLVLKGGTCLRKCFFPDYRFSEDLDFTAVDWFGYEELEGAVSEAFAAAQQDSGIDFRASDPRLRIVDDEYGRETIRISVYWRGPHTLRGSPPGLRLDITRNESLAFCPVGRHLAHPFSDAREFGEVRLTCYALEEVMCEKIRAVLGQRMYAVSRDLCDIHSLVGHVDRRRVATGLPRKLEARGMSTTNFDLDRLAGRRDEFQSDWERNLAVLLPPGAQKDFDEAWEGVLKYLTRVAPC